MTPGAYDLTPDELAQADAIVSRRLAKPIEPSEGGWTYVREGCLAVCLRVTAFVFSETKGWSVEVESNAYRLPSA